MEVEVHQLEGEKDRLLEEAVEGEVEEHPHCWQWQEDNTLSNPLPLMSKLWGPNQRALMATEPKLMNSWKT